jgi:hypothetical protein
MIFSLHGRWEDVYVNKGCVLPQLQACKIFFRILLVKEKVCVIWVLIPFIKGHFCVNYVLELQISW